MNFHNLKLAIRNLQKNKLYSILIISGFSIGFAVSIIIALFVYKEYTVDHDFKNYKQIYRLYDAKRNRCDLDYNLHKVLLENYPAIENTCPFEYFTGYEAFVNAQNASAKTQHLVSTINNYFDIFSIDIIESISEKPFSDKTSFIISESFARKLFNDKSPLGEKLNINNYVEGTISAIAKDVPENSSFKADIYLNSANEKFRFYQACNNGMCINPVSHFIQLKNNVSEKELVLDLNNTLDSYQSLVDSFAIENISDIYLASDVGESRNISGNKKMINIFLSIAILILILSSINYLNYTISMQYAKLKETGIKKTNGAGTIQLIRFFFAEVTLGIIISMIFAIIIVLFLLPYSKIIFGKELVADYLLDPTLLLIIAALVIVIILFNSIAPLSILTRFNVQNFLSGFSNKSGKQYGRQVFTVFQFTVSIALIVIVLMISKQISYVRNTDLGFNKEQLLRINLPYEFQNAESLKGELTKLSFVKNTSLSHGCPGMINLVMGSNTGENSFDVQCIYVDDQFLETFNIPLLSGRNFLKGDQDLACIMNTTALKRFEWKNIEGKRFNNGREGGYEVIGVTENFNFKSLHQGIEPACLIYRTDQPNVLSVRLSKGNIVNMMSQIEDIWDKFSPDQPFDFVFYDSFFNAMYQKEERLAKSIGFFSFLAIVLTFMGILGQIFQVCLNRTKEIGIRKVVGANIKEVLAILNKDFIKLVTIAFIIGCPVAWYIINKWLSNFAYKTSMNWWVFASAGIVVIIISLLTVSLQSWRTAVRNPVEALRYE